MTLKAKLDPILSTLGLQIREEVFMLRRYIEMGFLALMGVSGDLYNELVSGGYLNDINVPKELISGLHLVSLLAIMIKFVKKNTASAEEEINKVLPAPAPAPVLTPVPNLPPVATLPPEPAAGPTPTEVPPAAPQLPGSES